MKINDLKRSLKESTKEDLIKSIVDLYKKNDFVKDYYTSKYGDGSNLSILIKHKDIIENEFFPDKGDGRGRLAVAKKAITEFRKLSEDKTSIAELMIFYVETGVKYTDCYGDIDESFYLSMESMYERALKFIISNNLLEAFNDRCLKIVNDTTDMGWGFHDQLCEIYYGYADE
ncbi:MAG: hypothetical protein GXP09_02235 [Gammaproteobacteria bacterium]|nr:hypothetical protein [Gammaproteobacteria bacterium]